LAGRYVLYQLFFLYPLSPNGHWAYPFMDTGTLWVVPWMLGLLALHVIIFGACLGCGRVIRDTRSRRKHAPPSWCGLTSWLLLLFLRVRPNRSLVAARFLLLLCLA
jgi:hypothetical protein